MRILITGANGFIGSYLMEFLDTRHHEVVGVVRLNAQLESNKYFQSELSTSLNYEKEIDILIHTAGRRFLSQKGNFDEYVRDNIIATQNVLQFAKTHGVKKIIYLGSVLSYGNVNGVLYEDTERNGLDDYGITKYIAERSIEDSEMEYVILSLPGVIGKNCIENFLLGTAMKLRRNEDVVYYNGAGKFNNIVELSDLANFINHVIKSRQGFSDRFVLGTDSYMRVDEMVNFLKEKLHSNSYIMSREGENNAFCIDCKHAIEAGYRPKQIREILEEVCIEAIRRTQN